MASHADRARPSVVCATRKVITAIRYSPPALQVVDMAVHNDKFLVAVRWHYTSGLILILRVGVMGILALIVACSGGSDDRDQDDGRRVLRTGTTHAVADDLNDTEIDDLVAYLQALPVVE